MAWLKKNRCKYNKIGCMHPDRMKKCQYKTCVKFEV
jgi:hypothetical protein